MARSSVGLRQRERKTDWPVLPKDRYPLNHNHDLRCTVSELERVGRLPVFVDEEQWSRAFEAAKIKVDTLYTQGLIDVPTGRVVNGTLHLAAVQIATAALRAA